ncbi:MAG TPA: TIGR03435 family protein [Bryobacteraceae bacterium]|jgi:uncharacterized protein (TIGR03435 family)
MGNWKALTLVVGAAYGGFGQTPAASPVFEVASIKPSHAEEGHSHWRSKLGNLEMENVTLRECILAAYEVKDYQLSGPDWLAKERFDIVAKAPSVTSNKQFPAAMQTLLAERFHLAVHRETKPTPAYALVVAKGGIKMHQVEAGHSSSKSTRGRMTAQAVSMPDFAAVLMRVARLDRPVVDRTGLTGHFDFTLDFNREETVTPPAAGGDDERRPPDNPAEPSIFTALQEQLGLKLQAEKVPIDLVVVDRCDRAPAGN